MTEILNFWKELLVNPKHFFENEFTENKEIRFFKISIVIFCVGYGIEKIDKQLVKFDLKGNLDQIDFLNNWIGYWLFAIIGGAIGGYILYLIGGWFYNVRLKWSKGSGDLILSRNLYLYSNFFLNLAIILIALVETIKNSKPYDPFTEIEPFDIIIIPILIFFIFHSIYISFIGVTTVTNAEKNKAIIWFALIPILFYLLMFGALIILFISYF